MAKGYHDIEHGDHVVFNHPLRGNDKVPQQGKGKAVMKGPGGWVLNLGGRYGTPGIVSPENYVSHRKASKAKRVAQAYISGQDRPSGIFKEEEIQEDGVDVVSAITEKLKQKTLEVIDEVRKQVAAEVLESYHALDVKDWNHRASKSSECMSCGDPIKGRGYKTTAQGDKICDDCDKYYAFGGPGEEDVKEEYRDPAQVMQKHGWHPGKSGEGWIHSKHPGHNVHTSSSGAWQHNMPSPLMGTSNTGGAFGDTADDLDKHLRGFHAPIEESLQEDDYHKKLTGAGFTISDMIKNREFPGKSGIIYKHKNGTNITLSQRNAEGQREWSHYNPKTLQIRHGKGHNALEKHLTNPTWEGQRVAQSLSHSGKMK